MKITLFKYRKNSNPNFRDNYFANEITYEDKLELSRQLLDSFPIFKEEYQQEDDIDVWKTGYFDMKLSISMKEISETGKNIFDFFESIDTNNNKFKYLIVAQTGSTERSGRNYVGFIDLNTLEADLSVNENQYYIYFSVTGIEKEFVEWLKQIFIEPIAHDMDFESEYLRWHFKDINSEGDFITLNSTLNIVENIIHSLTVNKFTQNKFILAQADTTVNPPILRYTVWEGFKSFMVGYAFRFRLTLRIIDDNLPRFNFNIFFRTAALNTVNVTKFLKFKKALSYVDANTNIFIAYSQRPDALNSDTTRYQGFIMNKNNIFYSSQTEDILYSNRGKYYTINSVRIYADNIKQITLPLLNANLAQGDVAYCRLVQGNDLFFVMQYVANTQLGYLLSGVKSRIKCKTKINDSIPLTAGSSTEFNNRSYFCERINSYDNYNQTMETEWIEQ